LFRLKDPVLIAICARACDLEYDIFLTELEAMVRCARQYKKYGIDAISLPPATYWLRKVRLSRGPPMGRSQSKDIEKLAA
jgi:hypothetical protein